MKYFILFLINKNIYETSVHDEDIKLINNIKFT